jgi:hypothetical protein
MRAQSLAEHIVCVDLPRRLCIAAVRAGNLLVGGVHEVRTLLGKCSHVDATDAFSAIAGQYRYVVSDRVR